MRFSLGFIIALSLAGLQFIAITTVVTTSYVTSEKAMLEHARGLLADAGAVAAEHSKRFLDPAREAAELSSRMIENQIVSGTDPEQLESFLFQLLQAEPQIAGVYYGDISGNFVYVMRSEGVGPYRTKTVNITDAGRTTELIWRTANFELVAHEFDPNDRFDPRTRPWFKNAREARASSWTTPYIFFSSQQPGITVASPVTDADGTVLGVLGVDIEIADISKFLSQLTISDHGAALILNDQGDVIAHPNFDELNIENADGTLGFANIKDFNNPVARVAFADFATPEANTIDEMQSEFKYQRNDYMRLVLPIVGIDLPWTIAIYAPENDFIQGIKDNRRRNIWLAAIIAAITALAGLTLAELILRPVRAFAVRTALVSQGEVSGSEPLPKTYQELRKANMTLIDEIAQRRDSEAKIQVLNRDLSHVSRVNLMGQMATGLAHELSQPLTAISQNLDAAITTAQQEKHPNQELLSILHELDEQAHQGGDIIRALRGFVRKDDGEKTAFDLKELLIQTRRLMSQEADAHDITIAVPSEDLPHIVGNRIQIAQVLINLMRNAVEAIAATESSKGEIDITVHSMSGYIEVWVEDTGPGIAANITLFKQFETSKSSGMGLGLSICRTILEANGGRLWYDSESYDKTRFCLTLLTQTPDNHGAVLNS